MSDIELSQNSTPTPPLGASPDPSKAIGGQPYWKKALAGIVPFTAQRAVFGVIVVLAIIYLTFIGLDMAEGADLSEAVRLAIPDTIDYISRALQGDLGDSTAGSLSLNPVPVREVLNERLIRSLGLMGISLLFASLVGILLGVWAARGRSGRSLGVIVATIIGVSVPSFFAAFLLQWAATSYTRVVGKSLIPVGGFGWDAHLILPVIVLAARPIAQITRITFVTIKGALSQDYVRTAHGKGLHRVRVMYIHVMRNATIPILTTIGVSLGFILSSLPVVELYFGWPGIGFTLLKSIAQNDSDLTVALVVALGVIFLVVNFFLELSYRFIDPRLLEAHTDIGNGRSLNPLNALRNLWAEIRSYLPKLAMPSLRRKAKDNEDDEGEESLEGLDLNLGARRRSTLRAVLGNFPLVLGGILVLFLIVFLFVGPSLAPHSPYQNQALRIVDGQISTPPFEPSGEFPWGTDIIGRDLQSLIFSGIQQTLILVFLAVAARVVVGLVLGSIAGWRVGSLADRVIQGTADILAAYPTLLLTMIFILAFGIRKGMSSFVLALCLVGWGEIMRYVRSEVVSIRPKPFIESAIAVGSRSPRIFSRHIIPNIFAGLISIIALETGSVLMLLGELGFIGIFIGGGITILSGFGSVHYSDVPEWGALLSNLRFQIRSYPWTGLYPMLAFFLAILSFNLFSEGLRRMAEEGHLIIDRLINRYTIGGAAIILVGGFWLQSNSGSLVFYRDNSESYSVERALEYLNDLTTPEMQGRALGSEGISLGADYIAAEFVALGLQSAGQTNTYFQERSRNYALLEAEPVLEILDGGPSLTYTEDYAAYPGRNITDGSAETKVRVVVLGDEGPPTFSGFRSNFVDLEKDDFSSEIVMVFSDVDAWHMTRYPKAGLLVVTEEEELFNRRFTLSSRSGRGMNVFTGERTGEETPSLWISIDTAERILQGSNYDVPSLLEIKEDLGIQKVFSESLGPTVRMDVNATIQETFRAKNVLGYIPGSHSYDQCYDCLGRQLIVVMAQYDAPPIGLEGAYEAANDNASAVAVMLETIRVIQESEYTPYKTILFVAYSGEGLDGGEVVSDPDVKRFLQAKVGFDNNFNLEGVVKLRGLGGGSGDSLEISAAGSLRLAELLERSAGQSGSNAVRANEPIDISVIYEADPSTLRGGQAAPIVRMVWEGWEEKARTSADTFEIIQPDSIDEAGRTLALALMVMGREINY